MNIATALVVMMAIAAFTVLRMARYRALGGGERDAPPSTRQVTELRREIADLRKRLAVLERIATDDRTAKAIAHEIESLREH